MVFAPDILRGQVDVDHGRLNLRVTHEPHKGGHGDAGADHVGAECVAKPVRPGIEDPRSTPVVTKERAQPGRCHRFAPLPALEGKEQERDGGFRSFQFEVAPQTALQVKMRNEQGEVQRNADWPGPTRSCRQLRSSWDLSAIPWLASVSVG